MQGREHGGARRFRPRMGERGFLLVLVGATAGLSIASGADLAGLWLVLLAANAVVAWYEASHLGVVVNADGIVERRPPMPWRRTSFRWDELVAFELRDGGVVRFELADGGRYGLMPVAHTAALVDAIAERLPGPRDLRLPVGVVDAFRRHQLSEADS